MMSKSDDGVLSIKSRGFELYAGISAQPGLAGYYWK